MNEKIKVNRVDKLSEEIKKLHDVKEDCYNFGQEDLVTEIVRLPWYRKIFIGFNIVNFYESTKKNSEKTFKEEKNCSRS